MIVNLWHQAQSLGGIEGGMTIYDELHRPWTLHFGAPPSLEDAEVIKIAGHDVHFAKEPAGPHYATREGEEDFMFLSRLAMYRFYVIVEENAVQRSIEWELYREGKGPRPAWLP